MKRQSSAIQGFGICQRMLCSALAHRSLKNAGGGKGNYSTTLQYPNPPAPSILMQLENRSNRATTRWSTSPAAPVQLLSKSQFAAKGLCHSFAVGGKHTRELLQEAACVTCNVLDRTMAVYETLKPCTSGVSYHTCSSSAVMITGELSAPFCDWPPLRLGLPCRSGNRSQTEPEL